MRQNKSKSLAQKIQDARLLIEGALNQPVVLDRLARLEFTSEEILKGKTLLENVVLLHTEKTSCYGHQAVAAAQLKQDQAQARDLYQYHLRLAKLVFRHQPDKRNMLQLEVPRQRALAAWIAQASEFYRLMLKMSEEHARLGVTTEELLQAQAMIEAIGTTWRRNKSLLGEAQQATQERNQAIKALDTWISRFKKTARLALEEQDQLLEGMGLLVRSKA